MHFILHHVSYLICLDCCLAKAAKLFLPFFTLSVNSSEILTLPFIWRPAFKTAFLSFRLENLTRIGKGRFPDSSSTLELSSISISLDQYHNKKRLNICMKTLICVSYVSDYYIYRIFLLP